MVSAVGYKDIFIFPSGGLKRVRKELSEFNVYALLQFCSKLAFPLFTKGESNQKTQINMMKAIFPKEHYSSLIKALSKTDNKLWAIFHEHSALFLAKECLLYAARKNGKQLNPQNAARLCLLLLILTDEGVGHGWTEEIKLPLEFERERVREFMARGAFFSGREYFAQKQMRYKGIFDKAVEVGSKRNFDLNKIFRKAAKGLSYLDFFSIGMAIFTNWMKELGKDPDINKEWVVCKKKYFRKTKLTSQTINRFFKFNSIKVNQFRRRYELVVQNILQGNDVPSHNFLLFQKYPLIHYERPDDMCYVCPSPRYLMERITEGVYWVVEEYLKVNNPTEWRKWPEIWGQAYEAYANKVLVGIFGKNSYIANPKDKDGAERSDGVLSSEKALMFLEIKYMHWRYKTKITGNSQDMEQDLKQLFQSGKKPKGLGQLAKHIGDYMNEKWEIPEIKDDSKKPIIPILVVGESMPMDAYNRYFYDQMIIKKGIKMPASRLMPYIILDGEDLMVLETIAQINGREVAAESLYNYSRLFEKKESSGYVRGSMGFKNFAISQGLVSGKNKRLWREFDKLFTEVKKRVFGSK